MSSSASRKLSAETLGHPDVVAALQAQADRDIARFGLDPEEES